ncbi:uncharacterized protein LOC111377139 [Olea europaea var. sylvestris]|uniref:uncharacterized protein LOC111377139 n=1 Tax=Olea europaea var. sylvestris TaxID=158386 RepID=UPI000C1D1A6C|nr:uncharacterized protein LOC111377139 [Olea europaea var. sylvestris]
MNMLIYDRLCDPITLVHVSVNLNDTCKYDELVNLVISELGLNHAEVGVRLTYSLDSSLRPVRIQKSSITAIESSANVFSLQQIAQDIWGILFTACTQDANNNIFILTFGIGDNENDKSWRWFLEMLKRAYGSRDGLCIVSDRHNNIRNAIEFVYPEAMHGICSYHLQKNLKSHYAKSGHNVTHAFNSAVRAYTVDEFEYQMQQLDSINEYIGGYLLDVGYEKWSRLHMPTNRYSTLTSNIVESVNAVTNAATNYPIEAILESLRFPASHTLFEVRDNSSSYMIDITLHTCSCRMFHVDQLFCPHALAVIATLKLNVYDFCSVYYTRDAYLNTYKKTVFPVGNKSEWNLTEDVSNRVVFAPDQKRSSGRPTEKRKKPAYERSQVVKCGRCGEFGHNRRICRTRMTKN